MLGDPQSWRERYEGKKYVLTLPGIELWFFCQPTM
jgi:hypothetical protein